MTREENSDNLSARLRKVVLTIFDRSNRWV